MNQIFNSYQNIILDTTTQKIEFTGETTERPRMIRRNTWTKLEGDILVIYKKNISLNLN